MRREYQALVVEDSKVVRDTLKAALAALPELQITEAENGVDALRKLAKGRFDILLTDINMPMMDGLKLVHRVRTDPTHAHVPVVVITTESAEADRNRAIALGANDYLGKPVDADVLVATVRRLLAL